MKKLNKETIDYRIDKINLYLDGTLEFDDLSDDLGLSTSHLGKWINMVNQATVKQLDDLSDGTIILSELLDELGIKSFNKNISDSLKSDYDEYSMNHLLACLHSLVTKPESDLVASPGVSIISQRHIDSEDNQAYKVKIVKSDKIIEGTITVVST